MPFPARAVLALAAVLSAEIAVGADVPRPKMRLHLGAEPPVQPGQVVPVEIRLLDDAGAPVDAPVTLDVDAGKASPAERAERGVYRASLAVPRRLPSTRSIVVLARAGQSSVEVSLALAPGQAAALHLDGPAVCPEDAEACRIDVAAEDADGNPAAEIPSGSAELGRVLPAGWAEPGHWAIAYGPPRVDREATDRVTVELGKLRAIHELRLTPTRARFGFAPSAGLARQGSRTGFAAAAQVLGERRVGLGWLLGAGLEATWWSVSHGATASGLRVRTDRSQLGLGFVVTAARPVAGRLTAMFTVSGGAARVTSTDHVQGQPGVTDAGWAPSAALSAGLGLRFGAGMPFVEARQAWVGDAHLLTDPGAKWPLILLAGFRLDVR